MVTTDYFLEDSLVLGWVWERVKVKQIWIKYCLRYPSISRIFPVASVGWSVVLLSLASFFSLNATPINLSYVKNSGWQNGWRGFWCCGDAATMLDGLGRHCNMASHLPHRWKTWPCRQSDSMLFFPGLSVQACCTGRGIHHEQSLPQVNHQPSIRIRFWRWNNFCCQINGLQPLELMAAWPISHWKLMLWWWFLSTNYRTKYQPILFLLLE